MARRISVFVVLILCLSASAMAAGPAIPDMRGVWRTTDHEGITTGSRHFLQDKATPRFVTGRFTMDITEQQGRRFLGVKRSANHAEHLMGVIGYDGATLEILEDEGLFRGRLLPDGSMELLYFHDSGTSKGVGVARYVREGGLKP